jgi:hypothetical protein
MNGKFLLDTNIVVALFKDDPAIRERLSQRPSVLTSVVLLGELYYGAHKSARLDKHLRQINRFLREPPYSKVMPRQPTSTALSGTNCVSKGGPCPRMIFGLPPWPDSTI